MTGHEGRCRRRHQGGVGSGASPSLIGGRGTRSCPRPRRRGGGAGASGAGTGTRTGRGRTGGGATPWTTGGGRMNTTTTGRGVKRMIATVITPRTVGGIGTEIGRGRGRGRTAGTGAGVGAGRATCPRTSGTAPDEVLATSTERGQSRLLRCARQARQSCPACRSPRVRRPRPAQRCPSLAARPTPFGPRCSPTCQTSQPPHRPSHHLSHS